MVVLAAKSHVLTAAANPCAPGLPAGFCHHHAETSCAARDGYFCVGWAVDNIDRYVSPFLKQAELVVISVAIGFAIALALALLSHRQRRLAPPLLGLTGILYTIPSIAFFFLLLPITGFGTDTAVIALTAYTLQIIYRNVLIGLANVPAGAKDAGRGMGMDERQLLMRVELPLAVPEIVAGLRVATVSTVAISTLAFLAGAGGLGEPLYAQPKFGTNILLVGILAILMAVAFDALILVAQRAITPWRRAAPS